MKNDERGQMDSDHSLVWGQGKNELENKRNPKRSVIKILCIDTACYSVDAVLLVYMSLWVHWIWVAWAVMLVGLVWAVWNLGVVCTDRYVKKKYRVLLDHFTWFRWLGMFMIGLVIVVILVRVLEFILGKSEEPRGVDKFPGGTIIFILVMLVGGIGQIIVQYMTGPKYFRSVQHWIMFEGFDPLA